MEKVIINSVKVSKNKILVEYYDLVRNRPYSTEDKESPHPDFYNAVKALSKYLAKIFYVEKNNQDKIKASGFSAKTDESIVNIKGAFVTLSGVIVGVSSGSIDLSKDVYGIESEIGKAIETVKSEAYKFLFENKTAQGKLDFEDEDTPPEEIPDEAPEEVIEEEEGQDQTVGIPGLP